MKIVAISGKMHSGKSYVADRLIEEHGFIKGSFASALKEDVLRMGFPREAIDEKPGWMRELLQKYGQARRAVNPDHWVDRLMERLNILINEEPAFIERRVVIDDMRFENEADALLRLDDDNEDVEVVLLRLERGDYPRDLLVGHNEISETALDEYPEFHYAYTVQSGDLRGLHNIADRIVEGLNGRTASTGPEGTAE